MLETLKSVASLLASYGLLLVANGLFSTLLGVRARMEGFGTEVTGLIMSAYFVGLLTGALLGAHVVARVGHIRSFAAFASMMSVMALAHVMWVDPIAWGVMRAASGFCMAGMVMVTESWLNGRAENHIRGQVLALYMITNYFCAGLGQFLLPLADPGEFTLFCIVSMCLSLALLPVLMTTAIAPVPSPPTRGGFMIVYRMAPLGVLGGFSAGLVNASFNGMGPVYAQSLGLSLREISTFMGTAIFGGLLLQWPIGWLSDRIDRRNLLAGAALMTAAASIGVLFATPHGGALRVAAMLFYGSIAFTIYSLSAAHANDRGGSEQSVRVASAMLIAYGAGAAIGPLAAGVSMSLLGPEGLFEQSFTVMAWLGVYAVYRQIRRPDKPPPLPFVPQPGAQYSSGELDRAARADRDPGEEPTVPRDRS